MPTLDEWVKEDTEKQKKYKDKEPEIYIDPYNLSLLRGWKREQLQILKELTTSMKPVSQVRMANASGSVLGSPQYGGKITALSRANLMIKAGKDENNQNMWQLNEKIVDREKLKDFLEEMDI